MPHDDGAHKDLDGADALERDLSLAGGLVQAEFVPQLVLGDSVGVVDLVTQDQEGCLLQLLHRQQSIELGLGLGEALGILGVDEEDDARHLREVILPKTTRLLVACGTRL